MSTLKPLYRLPSGLIEDDHMCGDDLRFDYVREGRWYRAGIRFRGVAAIQKRAERCSNSLHLGTFPGLVEVLDSPWCAEVRHDMQWHQRDFWETHHYGIEIDNTFELIAASWELLPEELGKWRLEEL